MTDAANNVTRYVYDTENNLTGIQDANGHPRKGGRKS
jgi:YD repeat-containing protein